MILHFASSCLSHLPLARAVAELAAIGEAAVERGYIKGWGLQLCPGHKGLTPHAAADHEALARTATVNLRTHHSFSWCVPSVPLWTGECRLTTDRLERGLPRTVHPPMFGALEPNWVRHAQEAIEQGFFEAVEVMYAPYGLSTPQAALDTGLPLAIDVSHVNLWPGRTEDTLQLFEKADIRELHVSANDGTADQHRPLEPDSFGLGWALERAQDGIPLVLECNMRSMDFDARLRQVRVLAGARA